jgi:DNA polymerase-3 subunit epsilon/ATP-dependent DNA helicase DinG
MSSIVSIDIETTGLDSNKDVIIEIGAVKFKDHRVEDEFSTLINPGRHIPEFITQLTGISDEMVRQAPRIQEVIDELESFVGDSALVGHNVRFDLGFLQKQKILQFNEVIDTYELASVLLPTASRYNLGALGQLLGIPLPATHRALDDAKVTHRVYLCLREYGSELPLDLLAEITRLGEPLDWDANPFFQRLMKLRARQGIAAKSVRRSTQENLRANLDYSRQEALNPVEEPLPLDPDETAALLEYGGPFSKHFETFEQRPEQIEMLRAVTNALSHSRHLMVEAGTGVGKSFAYLIPAALFAVQNNTRVIVSTNTINLQDQLIQKDIPALREALQLDLRAAVLKGRSNYLCPRRVEILRHNGPRDSDEMRVLAKVLVWLDGTASGDRNDINLNRPAEKDVWTRLSAEDDACTTKTCLGREGGVCPFYRARQAALTSHILVVNHALLLADVATGSKVLPEYNYLIVDEAHHLEAATTGALSFKLTQNDLERMLREVGSHQSGVLGFLLATVKDTMRPSDFAQLSQVVHRAGEMAFRLENQARDFFSTLHQFISGQREGKPQSQYAYQERILPSSRTLPGWDDVEIAWGGSGETLRLLLGVLAEIYKTASDLYADGHDELEDVNGSISSIYRRLSEAENNISGMIHEPSHEMIYWIEIQPNGNRLSLQAAPLRVGPLIEKYLWHEKNSIILASATLTAGGDFNYIRNTLNADEADELFLGSPFDYENSTLLFLAKDVPEPNAHGYQQAVDRTLIQLCRATGGRTLVLFTSYAQLKRTSQNITGPLADDGIFVYEQGEGASPNTLLDAFKTTDRAVLLGTRSFWEGVDIPGEQLSVVVMVKLPFDVPSDPLIAARSETFEDPFNEYQLPEAILKFRQGFGRLIRTASDRGVVAVLDRRLLTKPYGRSFIESLPQCTLRQGSLSDLPKQAAKWLNL